MQNQEERNGIVTILKNTYWGWRSPNGRFQYLQYLWSDIPGSVGEAIRARTYAKYFQKFGKRVRIFQGVRIRNAHRMSIGDGVSIGLDNCFDAGGGLVVGDRSLFGPSCKIWTVNHVFEDPDLPIRQQGIERKSVIIGSDVWLAANVFVMPGAELPDGCVVTAGSVVAAKKYPPYSIIGGNPARVLGNRKQSSNAVENIVAAP